MGRSKNGRNDTLLELRKQAEQRLRLNDPRTPALAPEQTPKVVHELQVHQIELEMQNEELRRRQAELEEAHERYAELFELAPLGYFILDEMGRVLQVNRAGADLLGIARPLPTNKRLYDFICNDFRDTFYRHLRQAFQAAGLASCELELRRGDSVRFSAQLQSIAQTDARGVFSHYLTVISDVSERRQHEEKILRQANYDARTGLPNRVLLLDRLEQAVHAAHREHTPMALMYIDMDQFKCINDSLGHAAGDRLLQDTAARLIDCARSSDTVARLCGDEFCMILPNTAGPGGADEVAEKVFSTLAQPFMLRSGEEYHTSCSIGIAVYPDDAGDTDTLLRNADMAMYHAKDRGRNTFEFFTPEMKHKAMQIKSLERELHRALADDELELHYQPIIELASGTVAGVEALLRWRHPTRGLLAPKAFIPLAEETDIIIPLGDWVLRAVSNQATAWRREGLLPPTLWVNISCRQIRDYGFEERLPRILDEAGPPGGHSWLGLEITESATLELEGATIEMFQRINRGGIRLSVDDFGTGYSSLTRLKHLPVQMLKTDASFLKDVATSERDAALARAIVALAHTLGIKIIAEGIETREQLEFLRQADCDLGQGYYLSMPLVARELTKYLGTPPARIEEVRIG